MNNLENIIRNYIEKLEREKSIYAAFISGSYNTNSLGPQSDIDIFCLWDNDSLSERGRETFQNVEFEYFISPNWKCIDRLKSDICSMRIYSEANIILDRNETLKNLKKIAIDTKKNHQFSLTDSDKYNFSFWIDTIRSDGEDMHSIKKYNDFLFFTSSQLEQMSKIISDMSNKFPAYYKYGHSEMKEIDFNYYEILTKFLQSQVESSDKISAWTKMCNYISKKLGDIDTRNYRSSSPLKK